MSLTGDSDLSVCVVMDNENWDAAFLGEDQLKEDGGQINEDSGEEDDAASDQD